MSGDSIKPIGETINNSRGCEHVTTLVGINRVCLSSLNCMATIREIVIDCSDADAMATFWAAALEFEYVGAAGSYRALNDPSGGPKLIIQEVDEPKLVKNRVHFDLEAVDIRSEARRMEALGAVLLNDRRPIQEHKTQWMVLADPSRCNTVSDAFNADTSVLQIVV